MSMKEKWDEKHTADAAEMQKIKTKKIINEEKERKKL